LIPIATGENMTHPYAETNISVPDYDQCKLQLGRHLCADLPLTFPSALQTYRVILFPGIPAPHLEALIAVAAREVPLVYPPSPA
jgi:hypothetical protein